MKKLLVLSFLTIIAALLFLNKTNLSLWVYTLQQPCGLFFSDDFSIWKPEQIQSVTEACKIYQKSGAGWVFLLRPTYLFIKEGSGGAFTIKDTVLFSMHSVDDPKQFKSTALHELAHIIDNRKGNISKYLRWLQATNWVCSMETENTECTHSCKQYPDKAFYCSYKDFEVLPSRFGTPAYNPEKADVSINPTEDFAESARYFFEANDELEKTSPSRCKYMKELFWKAAKNSCFDCSSATVCK